MTLIVDVLPLLLLVLIGLVLNVVPHELRTTITALIIGIIGTSAVFLLWDFLRRTYLITLDIQGNLALTLPKSHDVLPRKGIYERTAKRVFSSLPIEDIAGLRKTVVLLYTIMVGLLLIISVFADTLKTPAIPVFLFACSYLWFYFATVVYVETESRHSQDYSPALQGLIGVARVELPKRCHRGDSHNIAITAMPDTKNPSNYLEIELQAAGMDIGGDEKQRQSLSFPKLFYRWNANFSKAGTHIVNVLFRELDGSGEVIRCAEMKEYVIRVVTLYRQYGPSLIIAIATIVTLAYTMRGDLTTVLHGFGV